MLAADLLGEPRTVGRPWPRRRRSPGDLLERYRADVFLHDRSPGRKSGLLTDLKVFLDDVRVHDWTAGLPANATYYRGEIPRDRKWLPWFIDEFVMGWS